MYFRFSALFFLVFVIQSPLFVNAQEERDFSSMSPTVKVIANTYTKNNQTIRIASGSGTVITPDGLILTNNHVVEKDDDEAYDVFEICITFISQEEPVCEYTASIVERNREMDLALLQVRNVDIRGNTLPRLQYLSYTNESPLHEEEEIFVHGYPGIGGETITITKGQISGFEKYNGFSYVKTDSVISFGNSGGTVVDMNGNFLGIPTFISSDANTLGYFLDIREAKDWIDTQRDQPPEFDQNIHEALSQRMIIVNDAKNTQVYTHPFYPKFTFHIPDDWEFDQITRYSIVVSSKSDIQNHEIAFSMEDFPFDLTDDYLQEILFKKIERNKEQRYKSYEREKSEFHGIPSYTITSSSFDTQSVHHVIPYGGTLFLISYEYDLKKEAQDVPIYTQFLENVKFIDPVTSPKPLLKLIRKTPPFSIETTEGWFLLENKDPYNEDLIATFYKPDNPEGRMYISHFELSQTDKNLSNEKFLQNILSSHESTAGFRLVSKNDDVVVDGLSGVSLTYTYQGEELNQTRKITKVYLRDTDDYYFLRYDDLDTQYEKYIGDFQSILQSFRNLNEETMVKDGEYKIGTLNSVFEDIAHHRYEQSIAKLKDEGIIDGYRDNTFRPEKYVSRAEALKIMLESKVTADKKKKNDDGLKTELSDFENGEYTQLDFLDTEKISWLKKYVRYARSKNIVTGYGNTMFLPDATVTIAEACKMLFGIYEIPVWNPDSSTVKYDGPWYKPYMDKGFSLEIIPYGIYVPDHQLTRAELAHIIATFLEKNS